MIPYMTPYMTSYTTNPLCNPPRYFPLVEADSPGAAADEADEADAGMPGDDTDFVPVRRPISFYLVPYLGPI